VICEENGPIIANYNALINKDKEWPIHGGMKWTWLWTSTKLGTFICSRNFFSYRIG
jgi:hypothetical protein